MIQALPFSKDIPPYIIAGREPICYAGINVVGLRRRGFSNETIEKIHDAYRIIYQGGLNNTDALKKIEDEMEMTPEISYIVNFIRESAAALSPQENEKRMIYTKSEVRNHKL